MEEMRGFLCRDSLLSKGGKGSTLPGTFDTKVSGDIRRIIAASISFCFLFFFFAVILSLRFVIFIQREKID